MKIAQLIRWNMLVLFIASFFVAPVLAIEDADIPAEGITQGEFAMWLVQAAGAEGKLPPAALAEDAINFLNNLGIAPADGWSADKKTDMKVIAQILGVSQADAASKSWTDVVKTLVEQVQTTVAQVSTTGGSNISPTISPGGGR